MQDVRDPGQVIGAAESLRRADRIVRAEALRVLAFRRCAEAPEVSLQLGSCGALRALEASAGGAPVGASVRANAALALEAQTTISAAWQALERGTPALPVGPIGQAGRNDDEAVRRARALRDLRQRLHALAAPGAALDLEATRDQVGTSAATLSSNGTDPAAQRQLGADAVRLATAYGITRALEFEHSACETPTKRCAALTDASASAVEHAALEVLGDVLPGPRPCSDVGVTSPSYGAFCEAPPGAAACDAADLVVTPSGQLRRSSRTPATLCVDVSEAAVDRPVRVTFSEGSAVREMRVWPGVPARLDQDVRSMVQPRMVVSGFPTRRTLRILGRQHGILVAGPAAPHVFRDIFDLVEENRSIVHGLRANAATADYDRALRALTDQLQDAALQGTRQTVVDKGIALAHSSAEDAGAAQREANAAFDAFVALAAKTVVDWCAQDTGPATRGLCARVFPLFPTRPANAAAWATVGTELGRFFADVAALALPSGSRQELLTLESQRVQLQNTLRRLCVLGDSEFPVVVHDLVLGGHATELAFDFARGLLPDSTREIIEDRDLYAIVYNVPADQALTLRINGRVSLTSPPAVLGVGPAAADAQEVRTTRTGGTEVPMVDSASAQMLGTRVLRIGRLGGGWRYRLEISAQGATGAATTIAAHALDVVGRFYFGVLAGFGADVVMPGTPAATRVAGTDRWQVDAPFADVRMSVPVLLTYYPLGRKAPGSHVAFGLSAGVDLLHPTSRFYLPGLTLSNGSVGLTAAFALDVSSGSESPARVGSGVVLESSSPPSLASTFGTRSLPRPGLFLGLTFDLDLFRVAFSKVFNNLPTLQ
ncbi:MAG: hypothetical protein EPO40_18715 [Myxococcaceae bacterium]|nr:MAG: hypothetical protein EPO40_18715 [Myxococcaceae bacterium]